MAEQPSDTIAGDLNVGPNKKRNASLSDWLGLIRFSHTLFALPFAALATVLAIATPLPDGSLARPGWLDVVALLLSMVTARSAAMAFNRLVDHRIDAENPRTQKRHLPAGLLTRRAVAVFTLLCSLGFVGSTALFLPNWLPLVGAVPVLLFLLGYSLAKRFTSAAHLWLGVALSLSPICAWVAIRGPASLQDATGAWMALPSDLLAPVLIAIAVATWVAGFDIVYACQDADYDREAKLHSVPAKFGQQGAFRIAAGFHAVMLLALVALPLLAPQLGFGWVYAVALLAIAGLIIRQHLLVRPGELDRVNEAFFHTNVAISVLLLVAGSIDSLWL